MKKIILFISVFIVSVSFLNAKKSYIRFNGLYDSTMSFSRALTYNDEDWGEFNWGWNNYASLRFRAKLNKYLQFGFALNLNFNAGSYNILAGGVNVPMDASTDPTILSLATYLSTNFYSLPFYVNSLNIGSIEIDRLFLKVGNRFFDINMGLIRFAKGFGYAFSPTDFFNYADPLNPEARKKGKLSLVATFYPLSMWKIQTFAIAPNDLTGKKGWGFKFGASTDFTIKKFNFEFLYSLVLPEIEYEKSPSSLNYPDYTNNDFVQILGFSMKADIKIGLTLDMIYRFEHRSFKSGKYYGKDFRGYEGLEAAIGIDYTIAGRVYLLLEYMFYGSGMLDWQDKSLDPLFTDNDWDKVPPTARSMKSDKKPQSYLRHDYIFGLLRVKINDFVSIGNTYLFGADDQSAILTTFVEIEPIQALTIKVTGFIPLGWDTINTNWNAGEFGHTTMGFFQNYQISVKVKF